MAGKALQGNCGFRITIEEFGNAALENFEILEISQPALVGGEASKPWFSQARELRG
jgi:hypothetical protein